MARGHTPPSFPAARRPIGRGNKITAIVVAAFAIFGTLVPAVIAFYTDWLWFGEVDYRTVFNTTVLTRLGLFFGFGLLAWVVFFLNGRAIMRNHPGSRALLPELELVQNAVTQAAGRLLGIVPLVLAVLAGAIGQQQWRTFLLFFNRQDFGVTDPQFGVDFGFYAFTLPVLSLVASALSTMLIVAFVIAVVAHYVLGAITVADPANRRKASITKPARMHLAVLAGLWMLLRVGILWLDRFYLLMKDHGIFTGGSYTDINAQLPAKLILMVIAAVVAISFFMAIVLKDMRIPAMATVLMLLSSLVIGSAWPLMMDRFSVTPNRAEKESEYISRNIEATRYAFGISDDKVTYEREWGAGGASNEAVANDAATVSNIRLLDPEIISETFTQQRQLKNFYSFPRSLVMDRYEVDGEMRDFVVSAREINPNELKGNQADWINRHTVYTHGNGFVAAQANQVDEVARDVGSSRGGYPVYAVSDLQTTDEVAKNVGIEVTEPRVYYGPVISSARDGADYAVVGTEGGPAVEYDTDTSTYTYQGKGGVSIGNVVQRAIFAARYQEMNLILSDRVNGNSKILFDRDPRSRVHKVAPWLSTDATTYPAVIDGRIKWIVDGYTTLASLPYVTRQSMSQSTLDSSTASLNSQGQVVTDRVAYIRNSVKAVVDAYDGTVELYAFDETDPVLRAWQGAFPGTVKPKADISEELMNHIRYPEDMFKVQRAMLARYHVSDAREFFTADRFWSVPEDPSGTDSEGSGSQPPYYVVAANPETGESSFQLITAFRGLERQFLAAHMSASSDPENFGKITVRVLPTSSQTFGPKQAQDSMMSSDQVARDQTLWKNSNDLLNGNLLTLPVGGGEILYVEPIYAKRKDQESAFPKLLRVLVFYKEQVGYAPTISEALTQVGIDPKEAQDLTIVEGDGSVTNESTETTASAEPSAPAAETPAVPSISSEDAVKNLNTALDNLRKARGGTHEEYGRALDALDKAVADYQATHQ